MSIHDKLKLIGQARRQKRRGSSNSLISSFGIVETELSPVGTVLVDGELWTARSANDQVISPDTRVTVIELHNHELVVSKSI